MDGKPIVKSHLPLCCFCNRMNKAHFPLECAQVWEEWKKKRYPCYKCQQHRADHMSEECWVIGDRQQMRQKLVARLETRAKQMECCSEGNQCPLLFDKFATLLKDYVRQLTDTDQQAFPRNEVTRRFTKGTLRSLGSGTSRVWVYGSVDYVIRGDLYTIQKSASPYPLSAILVCSAERRNRIIFRKTVPQRVTYRSQMMLQNCSISASSFSEPSCIREFAIYVGSRITPMAI